MSADKIVEKILSDARAEAQRILDAARREAEAIRARGEADAQRMRGPRIQRAQAEADRLRRMHRSLAELQARNEVLAARRQALDQVFAEAQQRLAQLPDRDYRQFLVRLVARAAPQGDEEIIASAADRGKLDSNFLDVANRELQKAGRKGQLKLSPETREVGGGLVLRGDRYEMVLTWPMLFRQARERLDTDIARLLFGLGR